MSSQGQEQYYRHNYINDENDSYSSQENEEDEAEQVVEELEENDNRPDEISKRVCGGFRGEGWFRGKVLDPRATWIQEWNRIFLLVCATGLFVDPLFFYSLSISDSCMCLFVDGWFAVTVTVLRCMTDALHLWNMWLQLKINRRSLHRAGDIRISHLHSTYNTNARSISFKNFKAQKGFLFDLFVILPLPQVVMWVAIPKLFIGRKKNRACKNGEQNIVTECQMAQSCYIHN